MKKLESTFLNMTVVMTIITLLSAGILAYVDNATKDTIAAQKLAKKELAIKDVLPENDRIDTAIVIDGLNVYKAYKGSEYVGTAIESAEIDGYSSKLKVMVGYNADGSINTYSVLNQAETPGLGTKMVDWFKTKSSIEGIMPTDENLTVSKDGGKVDAITAATISSRAFLKCIKSTSTAFSLIPNANTPKPITEEIDSINIQSEEITNDTTNIETEETSNI